MTEWDSKKWREVRDRKLREWFLGNDAAVQCFIDISTAVEAWDDFADRDAMPEINSGFEILLVHLPNNPFYTQHFVAIRTMLLLSTNAWYDSERMKYGSGEERLMAFFLRNLGLELVQLFAYLIGGWKHMRKISLEAREFFRHETFEDWVNEHAEKQLQARH